MSDGRRLLEGDVPLSATNEAAARERYARKGHPRSVKTWWARRPHVAMRGLLYGALVDEDAEADHGAILSDLASGVHPDPDAVSRAREAIAGANERPDATERPTVLDPFSGGGVIPYEAARLGLPTESVELNDVGVLVQRAILDAPRDVPDLVDAVERWGRRVIDRAEAALADCYAETGDAPDDADPIGYFWSRTAPCPDCDRTVPLLNVTAVSKKDAPTYVDVAVDRESGTYDYRRSPGPPTFENAGRGGATECPFCEAAVSGDYLQTCGDRGDLGEECFAVATVREGETGKRFRVLDSAHASPPEVDRAAIADRIRAALPEDSIPDRDLPEWSGVLNPALYGHDTVSSAFNPRQTLALVTVAAEIRRTYRDRREEAGEERARAVCRVLTALTDHLADWNSRFTMWIPQNEQVGRALAGPGVPMRWDYVEIAPFGTGPANLRGKLDRMVDALRATPDFDGPLSVRQGDATDLPHADDSVDLVATDPPYYDSLVYSGLAAFFEPWQDLALSAFDEGGVRSHADLEIVAHEAVRGDAAHEFYTEELTAAFGEVRRVLTPGGRAVVVYSHRTVDGWAALARAFSDAGLRVTAVVPLSMERSARPRSMDADALSSAMACCAVERTDADPVAFADCRPDLEAAVGTAVDEAIREGWVTSDLLAYAFGRSLERYTAHPAVLDADGERMHFRTYYEGVREVLAASVRDTVAACGSGWDAPTRVYVAWRLHHLGDALDRATFESLCRDADADPRAVLDAAPGVFTAGSGTVRLHSVADTDDSTAEAPTGDGRDRADRTLLLDDVRRTVRATREGDGVAADLAARIDNDATAIRRVLNVLAGTELARHEGGTPDEAQTVRRAIGSLAEGDHLAEAAAQRTLGDF